MSVTAKRILLGGASLLWMGLMFFMSASNGEASSSMSGGLTDLVIRLFFKDYTGNGPENDYVLMMQVEFFIRKAAHFMEFLILGGLFVSFLLQFRFRFVTAGLFAFVSGVLFAASDEFHQSFVEGRAAMAFDVLVDSAGVFFGVLIFLGITAAIRLSKETRNNIGKY